MSLPYPAQYRHIFVTFQKEGIHLYPGADTDPKLATGGWDDVSYLGHPHHHTFGIKVVIEVFHNERDIEYHQFSRWCQRLYTHGDELLQFDGKSCETIAEELGSRIKEQYPDRWMSVTVDEDGKNGSTLYWAKHQLKDTHDQPTKR